MNVRFMVPFLKNGDRQMSHCLRRLISPIAAVVGILAFGATTPARADLEIWLSDDNFTTHTVVAMAASGSTATFTSGTFNGITFDTLTGKSNSPGTATLSKVLGSTLDMINSTSSDKTVYIRIGDTGFTMPVTPPNISVNSHIGGSVVGTNLANVMNFQSFVDPSNGQNFTGAGTFSTSLQTPAITTGSFSDDALGTITSLGSPYSITQQFKVILGASGGEINFGTNTTLEQVPSTSVPEPSTLALTGLGALGLIGYGLRRRKALGA
jgi:hypothetical protein